MKSLEKIKLDEVMLLVDMAFREPCIKCKGKLSYPIKVGMAPNGNVIYRDFPCDACVN